MSNSDLFKIIESTCIFCIFNIIFPIKISLAKFNCSRYFENICDDICMFKIIYFPTR